MYMPCSCNVHVSCALTWQACGGRITRWQRRRTTAALAVAHTAEEADKVLLTSMYLAIGNSLNALPSQLGQLTMFRALVQASPCYMAGFLDACLACTPHHNPWCLLQPCSIRSNKIW